MAGGNSKLGCGLALAGVGLLILSVSIPAGNSGCGRSAGWVQTRADLQNIVIALKGYQAEYDKLPVEALPSRKELPTPFRGDIVRALIKIGDLKLNPRKIDFFEAKPAKKKSSGLLDDKGGPTFVDMWGKPYLVIMDSNSDGKFPNPATGKRVGKYGSEIEPPFLDLDVVAISSGPDGKLDTWEDNIVSWR
jgi:hypothetical protein